MRFGVLIALVSLFYGLNAFSQTDTAFIKVDSAMANPDAKTKKSDTLRKASPVQAQPKKNEVVKDSARLALEAMPRRAATRSAIIPGWGQITNKRWWKLPIVYGGYVSIGLALEFNQRYYHSILKEVQYRYLHDDQPPEGSKYAIYSTTGLISAKDFYRRNRDLSILGMLAMHTIQVIDAYVDAKMFRYDIGSDLSFNVSPTIQMQPSLYSYQAAVPSLQFTLSF
ncbi:hypothetical protein FW774_18675 [Pedobacter sp. BS3]|uniref:DUF5683 domain-containing protein n=1 Tax=Pedobacter sp. BS3 TaxID=2567937 RepID=UPI0011F07A8A|nr:DUF5683 domain-containing protein [Pedobacter sp. BS3]TZF81299.1 hypothetical protein FW774_18675 [Pedobacter sp. BS3]